LIRPHLTFRLSTFVLRLKERLLEDQFALIRLFTFLGSSRKVLI